MMLPGGVKIYLATEPVDLRGGFERLSGIVAQELRGDPRGGSLYLFLNRRRTHLKVLFYDRTGYCILYKRLDRKTFPLPTVIGPGATSVELSAGELELILQGIGVPTTGPKRPSVKKSQPLLQ